MNLIIKLKKSLLHTFTVGFLVVFATTELFAAEIDVKVTSLGNGAPVENGMLAFVHYEGRLENGEIFDKSNRNGEPFSFLLGAGQVIPGWEQGINGMKVGEKRVLTIPPHLAYGANGAGHTIPPNATLIFEVELVDKGWPPKLVDASPTELLQYREDGVLIVDIRREEEWKETGVIEGALTITAFNKRGGLHEDFQRDFFSLINDKSTPIVLYCRTGNRTGRLGNALVNQLGFKEIIHLTDGIVQWKKQGLKTVKYNSIN